MTKTVTRTPEPAHKRKPLNRLEFAQILLRQDGRCGCAILPTLHPDYADFPICGGKLDATAGLIDEHLLPLAAGGSNDLENRALLRKGCAQVKTSDYDCRIIAKIARLAGKAGQQVRRAAGKTEQIPSSGFQTNRDSEFKQGVGGKVVRRVRR
tara:strand:- start:9205 stop:9663 length:459 start_codon:yes stop_codon:yes gene_type:complete